MESKYYLVNSNYNKGLLNTIYIRLLKYIANIVKILIKRFKLNLNLLSVQQKAILIIIIKLFNNKSNQQITKSRLRVSNRYSKYICFNTYPWQGEIKRYKSNLVGISETTRVNFSSSPIKSGTDLNNIKSQDSQVKTRDKFNDWLAGLIDGDGSLNVSKQGYTSCEITVALNDEKALLQIKQKFGGSVKLRSGVQAVRYRLHNKKGMINLINAINGNIRNTKRLAQLHHICSILNIPIVKPINLTLNNSWFSGFFDADGTIGYYYKNNHPQLTISVSNKLYIDIEYFIPLFGGNIYYDRGSNGSYKWSIQSESDVSNFINYINNNPSRTTKSNKLLLTSLYYKLVKLRAYKAPLDSNLNKSWIIFNNKWHRSLEDLTDNINHKY